MILPMPYWIISIPMIVRSSKDMMPVQPYKYDSGMGGERLFIIPPFQAHNVTSVSEVPEGDFGRSVAEPDRYALLYAVGRILSLYSFFQFVDNPFSHFQYFFYFFF